MESRLSRPVNLTVPKMPQCLVSRDEPMAADHSVREILHIEEETGFGIIRRDGGRNQPLSNSYFMPDPL